MSGSSHNVTDHFLQETKPGLYNNLVLKTKTICTTCSVQNLDWSIIKNKKIKNMSIISVDLKHWNITNVVEHLAAS